MSNKQMNINNENQNEKQEDTNDATQNNLEYYMKNINNNPLIEQLIQDYKVNSKQTHQVNFPVTNLATLEKEKLYDTFIVFQNFLEMVNYSSKNLDFMFHTKLNNENQAQSENQNKNNPKSNEEKPTERNSNYNQDDVVTYQAERKSKGDLQNNENNANKDDKKEEVEEINFNSEYQYREVNRSERKNSVRSELNTGSNNLANVEANTSRNQEDESTRIRTNDIRLSFKKNQYESERTPKNEIISPSATRMNFRNTEDAQGKSENINNDSEERNLEIAKYEIIDDKSRKVKKVQLKKNVEFPKPTESKRPEAVSAKSSSVPKREEPKQIKKITARFNFKRNYSSTGKKSNEKVSEEKKKKSGDELNFKHYDKLESEQPSENRPNPYSKNSFRSSSVEKLKSISNENVLITGESSLKKLQNRKWSQPKYNNDNAEEEQNEEEGNEVIHESQLSEREDNRALESGNNNPVGRNITPVRNNQENYSKRENLENPESLEVNRTPPTMTKKEEEPNEEVVEELEEEEEESGLVNYEYANEDGEIKKSILVENSNLENSHHIDNPLVGESALGQSKDLFSSKIIEMTNELIRLKGENEKVLKMKSEYQKLNRKLKLEIEDLNERREKELKRLKAESDEFEERRDRELKRLKLDAEEFYERRERELREIEEMREEEMKKIQREKKQLERNIKLNLSIGNRRDKEEIESLKAQISKLQEDHRFKDNTNKLLIDRLRKQLEDSNNKITQMNKTIEDLKSIQKKRMNFSTSSFRANRNKSETKTTPTLRKTASVKEISTKPKDSFNVASKVEKKNENPPQLNYKTEAPKKKVEIAVEEVQADHNSSNYDLILLDKYHPKSNSIANKVIKTDKTNDGKIIKIYEDGRREILFSSGVRKEVHLDGYQIVYFTNKDIKQTFPDGKYVYFFSEAKTTQTNYPNGLQVFKFENGQIEKHHPDGSKQITFPDGTLRCILEDGYEETLYPDGSIQKIDKNGVVTIEYEDGVKEIKYPDGREIIEYPEGKGKRKNSD